MNNNNLIAELSGKQFLIMPGHWYDFDYIRNVNNGSVIFLNKILFINANNSKIQIGYPYLNSNNSKIVGEVLQIIKGSKMTILKTKPKKNYTRTYGLRQKYTRVLIKS